MRKIQADLSLTFRMPDEGLNINGILSGLGKSMSQIFFTLVKELEGLSEDAINKGKI